MKRTKKIISRIILYTIGVMFGWGLREMWISEFPFFMCFLFTALGIVGLLWIAMIIYDNY